MTNERLEELCALRAIGLLDPAEQTELYRAVDGYPTNARLLSDYTETAAMLACDAPQVSPPVWFKDEIMDSLPSRSVASRLVPFSSWIPYAIAASVMAVAVVQAVRITALKTELQIQKIEVTRLAESNALMHLRLCQLDPKDPAYQSSHIMVAWDSFQRQGAISLQNLPTPPAGHNYQLWVLDPAAPAPISAGLIKTQHPSETFAAKATSAISPGFAITLEPGGGSPQPTGSILFAVEPGQ